MSLQKQAEDLYDLLPKSERNTLYLAVVKNPNFPWHSPVFDDEYYAVRTWKSGTGVYSRDTKPLGYYIDLLAESSITPTQEEVEKFKKTVYTIYIQEIYKLLTSNARKIFINTLKNIPRAREGMEARKVWNTQVNLPFNSGPGRNFAAHWPKTVAPNRPNSRRLTLKRNSNNGLRRIQTNLFKGGKRSKSRKH